MAVMHPSRRRRAAALPFALVLLVALAGPSAVSAHAELVSTTPADGAELDTPPTEVIALFSEPLDPGRSSMDLLLRGSVVASDGPGTTDPTRIVLQGLDLETGEYEVRWTAAGADGHLERGRFRFSIVEPADSPSAPASSTPAPTDQPIGTPSPTPSPAATPSPVPSPDEPDESPVMDAVLPIAAMLLLVGLLGAFLLRRRSGPPSRP